MKTAIIILAIMQAIELVMIRDAYRNIDRLEHNLLNLCKKTGREGEGDKTGWEIEQWTGPA